MYAGSNRNAVEYKTEIGVSLYTNSFDTHEPADVREVCASISRSNDSTWARNGSTGELAMGGPSLARKLTRQVEIDEGKEAPPVFLRRTVRHRWLYRVALRVLMLRLIFNTSFLFTLGQS